jgi:hypothetical protein
MLSGMSSSRGGVPAGLIEQENGIGSGATVFAISARWRFMAAVLQRGHDHGGGLAFPRADGAEEIGRPDALILGRGRPGATPGPAPGVSAKLIRTGCTISGR